ncbi:hypothetical protein [Rhizobium sp. AAP43]|uniref:hypothetical protein n=1 Tax=Rhizobium sp. AAP43 TaxID=1523420 RepID=UPI000AD55A98|nr:hypothetical protein [Rhizobium sp. AAP43]
MNGNTIRLIAFTGLALASALVAILIVLVALTWSLLQPIDHGGEISMLAQAGLLRGSM